MRKVRSLFVHTLVDSLDITVVDLARQVFSSVLRERLLDIVEPR